MSDHGWSLYTQPDVYNKKCHHCNEPMRLDPASAVLYKSDIYHWHCLLTKLCQQVAGMNITPIKLYPEDWCI